MIKIEKHLQRPHHLKVIFFFILDKNDKSSAAQKSEKKLVSSLSKINPFSSKSEVTTKKTAQTVQGAEGGSDGSIAKVMYQNFDGGESSHDDKCVMYDLMLPSEIERKAIKKNPVLGKQLFDEAL